VDRGVLEQLERAKGVADERGDDEVVDVVRADPQGGETVLREVLLAAQHLDPTARVETAPQFVEGTELTRRAGIDDYDVLVIAGHEHQEPSLEPLVPVAHPVDLRAGQVHLAHLGDMDVKGSSQRSSFRLRVHVYRQGLPAQYMRKPPETLMVAPEM
jgi:hypothetical protein